MTVRIGTSEWKLTAGDAGRKRKSAKQGCPRASFAPRCRVNILPLLAPLFLAFEIWQLVMCERYVGIKQITRGADPGEMGPGEPVAFLWISCIILYGIWMAALLASRGRGSSGSPWSPSAAGGYAVRRNCGLKWILVVLTIEGCLRVAALAPLSELAWMRVRAISS